MKLNLHAQVAGRYKLVKHKVREDGTLYNTEVVADFPNLITDSGLDRLAAGSIGQATNMCWVGSGNSAPTVADTALEAPIAATTNVTSSSGNNSGPPDYYSYGIKVFRFSTGAAAGNISEVGVGPSGGNLFSRALVLDSGGNPTSITVLADEVLDVVYELRVYKLYDDVPWGPITIDGVDYSGIIRPCDVDSNSAAFFTTLLGGSGAYLHVYNGNIGTITGQPSGATVGMAGTPAPYVSGTFYRDITFSAGLTQLNLSGGISALMLEMFTNAANVPVMHQISVSPALPKDNTKVMSITFRVHWGRYEP